MDIMASNDFPASRSRGHIDRRPGTAINQRLDHSNSNRHQQVASLINRARGGTNTESTNNN